ncbi:DNA-directed RNA polymerase subunit alpha [Nitrospina gracilis]|uniref:DNA-directed RNA polymerase subunit alpha n=1 Tax=Nitrospina gracilis TaxID=35801 RepID=UPI001F0077B3|nr:DNA-directed RNA polymerase subunit alpha [Nitrospina gracilis]MCF8721715.1 DNA-directed RNA polymerase subunit alpha [Nitrospina gracilis Nb-211]
MMQGIVKPKRLDFDKKTRSDNYAKFQAGPFERGYGITVGNSLRRMLLSSIEGTAVIGVKFEGVFHEFSSIPGVMEDVTEIILNLKKLQLKLQGGEDTKRLYLKRNTAGEVLAKDFQEDPDVTILSPDHKIATLDSNGSLDMEVLIQRGRGYVPADRHDMSTESVQMIPVDALFSPVEKVNYIVEKTRVGQSTDYDSLVMELWTDGSITPEDAVAHAAKIVKDHMQIFINFDEEPEPVQPQIDEKKQKLLTNLAKSVEELELSVRSYNCLKNANITTIAELVQKGDSEMLKTRNFGRKSLNEIKEILEEMGLSLGLKLEEEDLRQIQAMRKKKEVELEGERA